MPHQIQFLTFASNGALVATDTAFRPPAAGESVVRVEFGSDGKVLAAAPVPTGGDWEPTFTLRAQDELAAPMVTMWAEIAERCGVPMAKVVSARSAARAMLDWGDKAGNRVKKAD